MKHFGHRPYAERAFRGILRPAKQLAKGYHVYYCGQWRLIESVHRTGSETIVEFTEPLVFLIDPICTDPPRYPSRSPEEQIAATGVEEQRRYALLAR